MSKLKAALLITLLSAASLAACSRTPGPLKSDEIPLYTLATPQPTGKPSAQSSDQSSTGVHTEAEAEEPCQVAQSSSRRFLPSTSAPPDERIIPAQENDCAFYNWSWQAFLFSTRSVNDQQPAFLAYEPFEQVFGIRSHPTFSKLNAEDLSTADHSDDDLPVLNAGFRQAGDLAPILVDQNRNPVFYSIHINATFSAFVRKHKLNQLSNLLKAPNAGGISADLEFPPGALELKAAWKIVEPQDNPEIYKTYYTMKARVPLLTNVQKGKEIEVVGTTETRVVTVALLSLHVVGVIEDHPEFIWATFEHADAQGRRDIAPAAKSIPVHGVQEIDELTQHYPLFNKGTPASLANRLPASQVIDASSQKMNQSTSVFRVYPASITDQSEEDFAITTLNENIGKLFDSADPSQSDWRRHYRMVGANWLDDPASHQPDGVFKANRSFENDPNPDAKLIMAGEDSLSSMAMESFTQNPRTTCLSCHNTLSKQIGPKTFLPPRRINVSNVLTFYARSMMEE